MAYQLYFCFCREFTILYSIWFLSFVERKIYIGVIKGLPTRINDHGIRFPIGAAQSYLAEMGDSGVNAGNVGGSIADNENASKMLLLQFVGTLATITSKGYVMKSCNNKSRKKITVGLVLDNLFEEYWQKIWHGVSGRTREQGINLVCFTGGSPLMSRSSLYKLISPENIDGLILGPIFLNCGQDIVDRFLGNIDSLPVITLGYRLRNHPWLTVDNKTGLRAILTHLIEDHGAKKIGFIGGPASNADAGERLSTFRAILEEHGIPVEPEMMVHGNFQRNDGETAVRELIDNRKVMPDALVGANDLMTIYAMKALQARGISVPGNIITAGFDDISESRFINPPLTTVRQPLMELGKQALDLMLAILTGKNISQKTVLPSKPVIRRSCGCFLSDAFCTKYFIFKRVGTPISKKKPVINQETFTKMASSLSDIFPPTVAPNICRQWMNTLTRALARWINRNSPGEFLNSIEPLIFEGFTRNIELGTWRNVSIKLFKTAAPLAGKDYIESLNRIYQHLLLFLAELQDYQKPGGSSISHTESAQLQHLIIRLSDRYNMDEVCRDLDLFLPALCLKACSISLYEKENYFNSNALIFYEFPAHGQEETKSRVIRFPSRQLVSEANRKQSYLFLVLPVFHSTHHFGFVVFEPEYNDTTGCEAIATQLGITFQTIRHLEKIQKHSRELSRQVEVRTEELQQEVIEKKKAYEALGEQKKQIEALYSELQLADKDKEFFFINLAHEMRTPLALIKNCLEAYIREQGMDDRLGVIKRNFDKLLRDTVNFLDTGKLERGQQIYDHSQVAAFSELCREWAALCITTAKIKEITIKQNIEDDIYVRADPAALDRIAGNLLDNALKYTDNGGCVTISLESKESSVILTVRDNGPGIPVDQLENIFKPYYQLSHRSRNLRGMGMGLAIIKKILHTLDTGINVESTAGEGTCFTVIFQKYLPCKEENISRGKRTLVSLLQAPLVERPAIKNIDPKKPNILIVDDNREMLAFLENSLKDSYNIFPAEDGREAIRLLKEIPEINLIISDIIMDGMDGYAFFIELAALKAYNHIPFIFLTARGTVSEKLKGLEEGAVDYIIKPFDIDELRFKIKAILRNRKLQKNDQIRKMKKRFLSQFDRLMDSDEPDDRSISIETVREHYHLSKRETELLYLITEGIPNREIGSRLNISVKTVETHIHNIYIKCKVQNRVELINLING